MGQVFEGVDEALRSQEGREGFFAVVDSCVSCVSSPAVYSVACRTAIEHSVVCLPARGHHPRPGPEVSLHCIVGDARPPHDGRCGQKIGQGGKGERRPGSPPRPGQISSTSCKRRKRPAGVRRTGGPAGDHQHPAEQDHDTGKARSADARGEGMRHEEERGTSLCYRRPLFLRVRP